VSQFEIKHQATGVDFKPDHYLNDVQRIDEGVFKLELRTPGGRLTCVVDREGNVQSMERR
jgi:hypothetical protein